MLEDVKECFKKNTNMILSLNDFITYRVNWREKYLNINEIASELNIGKDSIVFFDDSKFERDQMKKMNPEINVINVPKDASNFIESIEDTARILSNFGNAFMLRTDSDEKLTEFKKYLSIPIINGLSPSSHATQILSDVFTVEEIKKKSISKLNITWIGDSNNVLNSLIAASIKFSFKLNIGCPKNYEPNKDIKDYIKRNKNKISIYNDAKKAAINADVIFSDKVISMNDKVNKTKKLKYFKKFKIDKKLLNHAKKDCIFLHCLPRGKEVDEKIFYSKQSKVWQQALNRVHVQKSILLYCFGKLR